MKMANLALVPAIKTLRAAGVPDAPKDARRLLAWALGMDASRLILALQEPLPVEAALRFDQAIQDRAARKPVSHITGTRAFFGRTFHVTPEVLDPRPETETLVLAALERAYERVLDLGCGSGAILHTLLAERPGATGLGLDISAAALKVAEQNAQHLGVGARVELQQSDWFHAARGRFDLIVANPPYISGPEMRELAPEVEKHEPHIALTPDADPENDGLGAYRIIAPAAAGYLQPGGCVLVETGPDQGKSVATLFAAAGFTQTEILTDIDGRDRVVRAQAWRAKRTKAAPRDTAP